MFLRFFFHTGVIWGDIAARNLVIWVGFFGAFLATRENKQFRIDVLTRFFFPRLRLWLAVITDLFAAVVCGFLARASFTFVKVGIDPESTAFLHIPQTVVAMIVPVGFGLLVVQFLIHMLENIVAKVNIDQLFLAGLVPGILLIVILPVQYPDRGQSACTAPSCRFSPCSPRSCY